MEVVKGWFQEVQPNRETDLYLLIEVAKGYLNKCNQMEKQISNFNMVGTRLCMVTLLALKYLHLNCLFSEVGSSDWMLNKSQAIYIDIL